MIEAIASRLAGVTAAAFLVATAPGQVQAEPPKGEVKGTNLEPSAANLALAWSDGQIVLPKALAGSETWVGPVKALPSLPTARVHPVVIFMHGSSGIAGFVTEYQKWLADTLGVASVAPNSMAIPDRLTYKSPVGKDVYERVHALRLAELETALKEAARIPWVDARRILIVGTSEGSVPVARLGAAGDAGRIVYAWTCEDNYFVDRHRTAIPAATPVLNVIAARDPYFSAANAWVGGQTITGDCGAALKGNANASVVKLETDQHTVVNQPAARDAVAPFIKRVLKLD